MSNQAKAYKKTIAIQMDLNWDGDPSIDNEEEEENNSPLDEKEDNSEPTVGCLDADCERPAS